MNKLKVLIFCVNYNSYRELKNYLSSIDTIAVGSKIDIFIADNSSRPEHCDLENFKNVNITLETFENKGYLGGVSQIIKNNPQIDYLSYDFVIISNVDVILDSNFFIELSKNRSKNNIGWLAPKIISLKEMKDRNPKLLSRISKRNILILLFLYRNYLLYNLYVLLLYRNKKQIERTENLTIYAGHGSFMIFNSLFFEKIKDFSYPPFLFAEEIFFAELAKEHGFKVEYVPSVSITDVDHASTGSLKRKKYCDLNYQAITFIKKTYYEQD